MLSKKDIEKELGKGINIYPLRTSNIKGNSINFTIGKHAWTLGSGNIIEDREKNFILAKNGNTNNTIRMRSGYSAIHSKGNKDYLVILPHSTTIVETSEVIGVSNYIGGTLHSKVGIVAQGIGDIGTMLGPSFCGHLMISLHNITNEVVTLPVGETFVSLVFHYLDTPTKTKNPNISGHVDKLAELGINITSDTRKYLTKDWKCSVDEIRNKMISSKEYISHKKALSNEKFKSLMDYVTLRNIIIVLISAIVLISLGILAKYVDDKSQNNIWMERYWTVILSGIIVPMIMAIKKLFNQR